MDFNIESVSEVLSDLSVSVFEIHGIIAGTLCVTNNVEHAVTAVCVSFDADTLEPAMLETIKQLCQSTFEQLQDDNFAFQLLLPHDDVDLNVRTEAMALWAQGFISGLGEGASSFGNHLNSELREMFDDVAAISQADPEVEESDEGEQYYAEITEYLRVIVMGFYVDFLTRSLKMTPSEI